MSERRKDTLLQRAAENAAAAEFRKGIKHNQESLATFFGALSAYLESHRFKGSPDLKKTILDKVASTNEWVAHPRTLPEMNEKLAEWHDFMEEAHGDCPIFEWRLSRDPFEWNDHASGP